MERIKDRSRAIQALFDNAACPGNAMQTRLEFWHKAVKMNTEFQAGFAIPVRPDAPQILPESAAESQLKANKRKADIDEALSILGFRRT